METKEMPVRWEIQVILDQPANQDQEEYKEHPE
jgi:hypothetical protein